MTKNEIEKAVRRVARKLGIRAKIRVVELTKRQDPKAELFGLWCPVRRCMYLRFKDPEGRRYSSKFLLATAAHELSHYWASRHDSKFRRTQRKVSRLMRDAT